MNRRVVDCAGDRLHNLGELANEGIAQQVWEEMKALDGIRHNVGEHISLNRFMGMIREGQREDVRWHRRLLAYLVT